MKGGGGRMRIESVRMIVWCGAATIVIINWCQSHHGTMVFFSSQISSWMIPLRQEHGPRDSRGKYGNRFESKGT